MATDGQRIFDVKDELRGLNLGDARREAGALMVARKMSANPQASFPELAESGAELERIYRLLGNSYVLPEMILEPHFAATAKRAQEVGEVLVVHDTTEFRCRYKDQADVGRLREGQRGFLGHYSLAVVPGEARYPLGAVAARTWSRSDEAPRGVKVSKSGKTRRLSGAEYAKVKTKESRRWLEQVEVAADRLDEGTQAIHVMDREADAYELLAGLVEGGHRFVVRLGKGRNAFTADGREEGDLADLLARQARDLLEREVRLSRREKKTAPRLAEAHPARSARTARLRCAAMTVMLKRPRYLAEPLPAQLRINIVWVHEVDCPPGAEPVDWILATTESIDSAEDVARVVDIYRSRWVIEDFFKAIKTGCAFGRRQLELKKTLQTALAFAVIVAWQLLVLRSYYRHEPDAGAERVLTDGQLQALRALSKEELPRELTVETAFIAIARLGGHRRQNGEPGWMTLMRGVLKITMFAAGYRKAVGEVLTVLDELHLLDRPDVRQRLEGLTSAAGLDADSRIPRDG